MRAMISFRPIAVKERDVALVAILSFVSVACVSATIWENGDIEEKWLAIKAWAAFDFPDLPASQHNLRWGINFLSTFFVSIFGDSPRSYLALNYLVFSLATAGLYRLARDMTSSLAATAILAIWFLNPIVYFLSSNLMPEVFGVFYLVMALMVLRASYISGSRWTYAFSILIFFLMYGAKETNAFFMPGLALYELIRKKYANVLIIIGVYFGCLALETGVIDFLLRGHGILFGRAQAIMHGEFGVDMQRNFSSYTPVDMFRRWWFNATTNLDRLGYFSQVLYFVFFGQSAWYLYSFWLCRAGRGQRVVGALSPQESREADFLLSVVSVGLSFAFCTTFFVISLNPFMLGQPLSDRYLWVLLVPTLLLLSHLLFNLIARFGERVTLVAKARGAVGRLDSQARGWVGELSIALIICAIIGLGTVSRSWIDSALVNIRRSGYARPYSFLGVDEYYGSIRQRLVDGCTLVFATQRAAWSALIYAFPYRYFREPVQLYKLELDQLHTQDGNVIQGWQPDVKDWAGLSEKLYVLPYVRPEGLVWEIYAIRFEPGSARRCDKAYYLGHVDLQARDQELGERVNFKGSASR
jgi:hypothetical protein